MGKNKVKNTEFIRWMTNPPKYIASKPFYEQSKEVLDFYEDEFIKITEGFYIDGVYIHPWLYWHLNYFETPIPTPLEDSEGNFIYNEDGVLETEEIIKNPPLDDHFYYFLENYRRCPKEQKALLMFGCRGFSKSSILSSNTTWLLTTKENGKLHTIGGNDSDLDDISKLLETGFDQVPAPFNLPRNITDWSKHVEFGVKTKSNKHIIFSNMFIKNAAGGTNKSSEKGAGGSPIGFNVDEIGKWDFLGPYTSGLPAFKTQYGWKAYPLLMGCLTAGNKVFTKDGRMVNIEDLTYEDGIVGYDIKKGQNSFEDILNINPPQNKICYKITTNKGTEIECSYDHPILVKNRNKIKKETINGVTYRKRKLEFVEAEQIKVGNSLCMINELPLTGKKEMWNPYFIGLLIGDGNYGHNRCVRFYNEDQEVWDYVDSLNLDYTITKQYVTKKDRLYRESRFRGINKYLRELGIFGQVKEHKDLPDDIHSYKEKDVSELIAGLFDSDGTVNSSKKNNFISISSISKKQLISLKLLMMRLGIHSNLCYIKPDNRDRKIKSKKGYYKLDILDKKSILIFCKKINLRIQRKSDNLLKLIENFKKKGDKLDKNYENLRFERVVSVENVGMKPVYNLTTSDTHTYVANGIVTHNTGGNNTLSKDAKKALKNPAAYDMLEMDWSILNKMVPKEFRTWDEKKFGVFVPGQMSYRLSVLKKKTTFAKFLGVKSNYLDKIEMYVTDWEACNKYIQEERERLKRDEDALNKFKMYHPINVNECFLESTKNPFPVRAANRRLEELEETGNVGQSVELYRGGDWLTKEFSDKEKAEDPHPGGEADAPVVIYNNHKFPEKRPPENMYVSGMDGYKTDVSDTDSVGAFYVLKRRNLDLNEPVERIVASYAARPPRMIDFHNQNEILAEGYNAPCCMESVDTGFIQHMDLKGKAVDLLTPAINFSEAAQKRPNRSKSRFGIYPTKQNQTYMFNLFLDFCKEPHVVDINEDGTEVIKLGVEFIDDPDLLREIIRYKPDGNHDRMVAFMHALTWCRELDKKGYRPIAEDVNKPKKKKPMYGTYGRIRTNPY